MYLCSNKHTEVCYVSGASCPVCPLEERVTQLETRLEQLLIERDAAEARVGELIELGERT